jgi:hypothetical protein
MQTSIAVPVHSRARPTVFPHACERPALVSLTGNWSGNKDQFMD